MATKPDIRLPADSILALRRSLIRQLGADAAIRALQEAGHAAGDALFDRLEDDGPVGETPRDAFWDRVRSLFNQLGWGAVSHETPHPGVGALVAHDWFEVEPDAPRPSCPFSTGVLANLLGQAAGDDVAVLQVPCEDDERCVRFLYGAPATLDRLYAGLREGADVDASLAALA